MIRALLRQVLLVIILAAAALVPATVMAQRSPSGEAALRDGVAAAERGDYASARKVLAPIAGHPHAAFVLGTMAMRGLGGPVDTAAAGRYFSTGATQGHPGALFNLGYLHDRGWGVQRDGAFAQQAYIATAALAPMVKNNLAYLWGRQGGLLEEALCLSAETLVAEPDSPVFLDTYGFILLRLNQPRRAEAYFRKALGRDASHPGIMEHVGDVLAMTSRSEEARDWYRRAADKAQDARQASRLAAKLGGAPAMHDLDQHPPFPLRGEGFTRDCGVPSV